jgi:hypothetical protein
MLAGSVTFLVSLYFAWVHEVFCISTSVCLVSHNPSVINKPWSGFGQIAALLAITLAAGALAAMADDERATRLPVGRGAIALGIFALLSVSELWTSAVGQNVGMPEAARLGPGAYIGLAGVGVACAGAAAARWSEITRPRSATAATGRLITLALIASFVLPALNASGVSGYELSRLQGGPADLICVFACLGLLAWREGQRPAPRLAIAAAIGTLVAAHLWLLRNAYAQWPYELWLLLACAAGLLVLGLAGSSGLRLRRLSVSERVIVAASVLMLVSLFLPWQSTCEQAHCSSQQGWSTADFAGVFTLGLLLALVWAGRVVRELAIGAAIFVLSAGLATVTTSLSPLYVPHFGAPPTLALDYGAPIGFAGAALLLVFALGRFRPNPDTRLLVRLGPVLAALGLLSFEVAPQVVSLSDFVGNTNRFGTQSPFLGLAIFAATAIFLTLRLLLRWVGRARDSAEVVLLPLGLLTLTALSLGYDETARVPILDNRIGVSWEGWVAVFLGLLLVACGWVVRKGAYPWERTDGSASTMSLATRP